MQSDSRPRRRKWNCGSHFREKKRKKNRAKTLSASRGEWKAHDKTDSKLDLCFCFHPQGAVSSLQGTPNHSRVCMWRRSCGAPIKENTFAGKAHQSWRNSHHLCSLLTVSVRHHPDTHPVTFLTPGGSPHLKRGDPPVQPARMPQLLEPQLDISCTDISCTSQNNFQQPRERDVLTMTHRRGRTITPHFKPPDVIRDCKSLKCTQTKSLKSTHKKIRIYLSEASDMNDAAKTKEQNTFTDFYNAETGPEMIYNQQVCVYVCRRNFQS